MHRYRRSTAAQRTGVRAAGLALVLALLAGACTDESPPAEGGALLSEGEANPGPLPTLAGGVDLQATELTELLGGEDLAYGAALPSEEAAAQAYLANPEVRGVLARRVVGAKSGRTLADVVLLRVDGAEFFDAAVLDGFLLGLVEAAGGTDAIERPVGKVKTVTAPGPDGAASGYRIGDLIVLVTAPTAKDADLVVARQLAARAAGQRGSRTPATPLLPALPVGAAFVEVPSVTFVPFPPPEDEDPPVAPPLRGGTGATGRYGVVAGERRTTVWAYALDPGVVPTAEAATPGLEQVVSLLAGGAAARRTEVIDRMVLAADPPPDAPPPDPDDPTAVEPLVARAFLHGRLALVVTGRDAAEVDAAVSDWIHQLATP